MLTGSTVAPERLQNGWAAIAFDGRRDRVGWRIGFEAPRTSAPQRKGWLEVKRLERLRSLPIELADLLRRLRGSLRVRFASAPAPLPPADRRYAEFRDRAERLESVVEALQDALYRETQRQDERIPAFRARTEPDEIARALSADARKRGL